MSDQLYYGDSLEVLRERIASQSVELVSPRAQAITIAELLGGKRPKLPPVLMPYIPASKMAAQAIQPRYLINSSQTER